MPKVFGRDVPPIILAGAVILVGTLFYTQLFPADNATTTAVKKTSTSTTKTAADAFTPEDRTIHFASYQQPTRNSFTPLVVRKTGGKGVEGGIPSTYTGGEQNWVYSGMAVVDGVSEGLLENRTTFDSEFVHSGQSWKSSTIGAITGDSLILTGPGGSIFVASVSTGTEQQPTADVNANGGVAPVAVPPGMVGPIGGNDLTVQPNPNSGTGNGRRGRRFRGFNNFNNQGNQ